MFNLWDKVRVVNKDNKTIKEGIVTALTNKGARVYDPKTEAPFTDSLIFPEWFAFQSEEINIFLIKPYSRKS